MRVPDINKLKKNKNSKEPIVIKKYTDHEPLERIQYDCEMDDKSKMKLIKTIEKLVRSSLEYRKLVAFLREHFEMNKCAYFNNVSCKKDYRVKIELHHSPFTLYDICYVVLNKHFYHYGCEINLMTIVYEIVELHYRGLIGLIPLSQTVHELVHTGNLFIPMNFVFGMPEEFFTEYDKYMSEQQKDLYNTHSKSSVDMEQIPDILKKSLIYIENDDFKIPEEI